MSVFAEDHVKEVEVDGEKFVIKKISVADQCKIQETATDKNPMRGGILMVAYALKSWTVKDKDGKILPINEDILLKFRMDVMNKLTKHVLEMNGLSAEEIKNLQARPDSTPKATG